MHHDGSPPDYLSFQGAPRPATLHPAALTVLHAAETSGTLWSGGPTGTTVRAVPAAHRSTVHEA
ncbi:hypothetical protein GCM10018771_01440 [Streptomyces cellulosae]|nr:hypothetical protein GCM10018771_01440 [Streptomyces cellulosae]